MTFTKPSMTKRLVLFIFFISFGRVEYRESNHLVIFRNLKKNCTNCFASDRLSNRKRRYCEKTYFIRKYLIFEIVLF